MNEQLGSLGFCRHAAQKLRERTGGRGFQFRIAGRCHSRDEQPLHRRFGPQRSNDLGGLQLDRRIARFEHGEQRSDRVAPQTNQHAAHGLVLACARRIDQRADERRDRRTPSLVQSDDRIVTCVFVRSGELCNHLVEQSRVGARRFGSRQDGIRQLAPFRRQGRVAAKPDERRRAEVACQADERLGVGLCLQQFLQERPRQLRPVQIHQRRHGADNIAGRRRIRLQHRADHWRFEPQVELGCGLGRCRRLGLRPRGGGRHVVVVLVLRLRQ